MLQPADCLGRQHHAAITVQTGLEHALLQQPKHHLHRPHVALQHNKKETQAAYLCMPVDHVPASALLLLESPQHISASNP